MRILQQLLIGESKAAFSLPGLYLASLLFAAKSDVSITQHNDDCVDLRKLAQSPSAFRCILSTKLQLRKNLLSSKLPSFEL